MRRRLDNRHLEGRPHDPLEEMAATRGAVAEAEHSMHVQARLAGVTHGDVAEERQALALLLDLDRLILLGAQVEPADCRALERAEGREGRAALIVPVGEVGNGGERRVTGIKHDHERPFAGLLPDQARFHRQNRASRMMIGSGMPSSQSMIPRPIPIESFVCVYTFGTRLCRLVCVGCRSGLGSLPWVLAWGRDPW